MYSIHKQKGMTAIGWVLVFMLIAIATLFTLKLLPIYLDGFAVKSSLESLKEQHNVNKMSPARIKQTILKRLDINMVTDVSKDDIYIEKDKSGTSVEIDYEVRDNLVGNLDIVVSFDYTVDIP